MAVDPKIASTAAAIMAECQLLDYQAAKRKAMAQLGLPASAKLPSNLEVEAELKRWLAVFAVDDEYQQFVAECLVELENARSFFKPYSPSVVGSLVRGTFILGDVIRLHVFADFAEEVMMALDGANIPYELAEVQLSFATGGRSESFPQLRIQAGNAELWVTVFATDDQRRSPISIVTKKPSKRYSGEGLQARLTQLYG